MKKSATQILNITEHFDGGPDLVPALDLLGYHDVCHLKTGKTEGEENEVKEIQDYDVECPADHVILRIEGVENENGEGHYDKHRKTNEVPEGIAPSHQSVDLSECLVDLLRAHTCHVKAQLHRHSKNESDWDANDPAHE